MRIYLGAVSPTVMQQARDAAPKYSYGACWTPVKMTPHDWPYILDNGVYAAWANGETWNPDDWLDVLSEARDMPREPDFVILPDKLGDAKQSYKRTKEWTDAVPHKWDTAMAVQDGMQVEPAVDTADDLGCTTVFVGGTMDYKRRYGDEFVMTAHDYGLECHIARPGLPDGLMWAEEIGADSVDTTTIARNRSYNHLTALAEQSTLQDALQ